MTTKTPNKAEKVDPLRDDFRKFLYVIWKHLNMPDPTPVQYDIAQYLQHGPRRKMVQAFRGVGKSWMYAAFVCWRLYRDPDYKIMVVSATKPLADALSQFIKQLIDEMPMLQHLAAKEGQLNRNDMFNVGPAKASKDPSVKSVGIFGQITGSRADEILADDIESLQNSATEGARKRLSEAVKEFDAVLKPGGSVSYLGTPQSFVTMYSQLPERGYEVRIWPAQIPKDPMAYSGKLAPYIMRLISKGASVGAPVDPKRFDTLDLAERNRSYGNAGYALQFMLDTTASDALRFPLKLKDLIVMNLDTARAPVKMSWGPEEGVTTVEGVPTTGFPGDYFHKPFWVADDFQEYQGAVMAIDPSGRGKDETGYAVVKQLHGQLFVTAAGGLKGGYEPATLQKLAAIAKTQKVNHVIIEKNFGDGMFTQLLKPVFRTSEYPVKIEEVHSVGQKELRIIDVLEPIMMQHRLIVSQHLIEDDNRTAVNQEGTDDIRYSLFFQMTRITRDRGAIPHDDRLEALAMAVAYWVESMAKETDNSVKRARDKLVEQDLKEFVKGAKRTLKQMGMDMPPKRPGFKEGKRGRPPRGRGKTVLIRW